MRPVVDASLRAAARGYAMFFGAFGVANAALGAWRPEYDANAFWIGLAGAWVALPCAALLAWSLAPRRRALVVAARVAAAALAVACLRDALLVSRAADAGSVRLGANAVGAALFLPAALSASIVLSAGFAAVAWGARRVADATATSKRSLAGAVVAAGACALAFPLLLAWTLGSADYRRPADVIVVLGARAYADGSLSHALHDRVRTAAQLYREGRAPVVWMSGGPGDGAVHEVDAMAAGAVRLGVPDAAIRRDYEGFNTMLTARNLAPRFAPGTRVIAVSHGFHLARVRLAFARASCEVVTVPADSPERPLRSLTRLTARDAVGFWAYWSGLRGS